MTRVRAVLALTIASLILAAGLSESPAFARSCPGDVELVGGEAPTAATDIRVHHVSCKRARRMLGRTWAHLDGRPMANGWRWRWTDGGVRGWRGKARVRARTYTG